MSFLNSNINRISEYPFNRLRNLISQENIKIKNTKVLDLSIGQPHHSFPMFVKDILIKENAKWNVYPPVKGIAILRQAYLDWLRKRFGLDTQFFGDENILPLSGTREGLFSISLVLAVKQIIVPNPFYQVYLGASLFQNLPLIFMNTGIKENYLLDLDKLESKIKKKASLIYFCNPSNPQGKCASVNYLKKLMNLVRKYKSILVLDECYIDIYTKKKPIGGMQVCQETEKGLSNILIFHSLSKRSNVPGLRSGFVVGDQNIIKLFAKLRSYSAPTMPLPIQTLSAKLWSDERHVQQSRNNYNIKFNYADKVLSSYDCYKRPEAGFYLWMKVGNGEKFTTELYKNFNMKVMPGKYLSYGTANNPGKKYIRVSLVHNNSISKEAINKIAKQLKCFQS
ncbi:aminotransferase class I/II-fold pyridoxal phosphate-dependent enzyme [Alphaproteobacteria bacterium]|nr:aminotransferase class I/II-fold pyridoxal phosphate-dependent enzyme [Alphaproteobacteria bacterium]